MKTFISSKYTALIAGTMITLLSSATAQEGTDSVIKQFETPLGGGDPVVISTIYFNGPDDGEKASGQKISLKNLNNQNNPFYELWSQGMGEDTDMYLLDVASTGPKTTLTLVSGDSFKPTRTRADQPFGLLLQSIFENNPVPEEGEVLPEGHVDMEKVYYRHTSLLYGSANIPVSGSSEAFVQDEFFTPADIHTSGSDSNVLFRIAGVSQLPLENDINFKQRGQDIFRVYAVTHGGSVIAPLAQGKMQVWPIAEGAIELVGYKPYDTITRALPDINITLKDLYPYSTTYALIYKGTKAAPLLDGFPPRIIEITRRSLTTDNLEPQNISFKITANEWQSYVPDDCEYTIEIVTHTPFEGLKYPTTGTTLPANEMPTSGGLSLFYTSFSVDRTISVNANVITSE